MFPKFSIFLETQKNLAGQQILDWDVNSESTIWLFNIAMEHNHFIAR